MHAVFNAITHCNIIYKETNCCSAVGHTFSGKVTEPATIAEGMVNVKFNANCISILCPIKEIPIKTWRLDQITSFGQCGGMLMFESCSTCSDPGAARCSMNIIQEKPTTILNLMEKAIRNNPNTGEIHYERSILGDIYHCDHDCCQSRGMLAAFSEPNLFLRSASASPVKRGRVPVEVHDFDHDLPDSTNSNDTDSGFPGTPKHADALSITSSIPSPIGSNKSNPSFNCKPLKDNSSNLSPKRLSHPALRENRSMSEAKPSPYAGETFYDFSRRRQSEGANAELHRHSDRLGRDEISRRLVYSAVSPTSANQRGWDEDMVQYSTVQVSRLSSNDMCHLSREEQCRLYDVEENIYDHPNCEPTYWEVAGEELFSPPSTPLGTYNVRRESGASNKSFSTSIYSRKTSSHSNTYPPGSDKQDREDDFDELPPIPKHHRRPRPAVKELVKLNGGDRPFRPRLHSTGDVLESSRPKKMSLGIREMRQLGSMDNLEKIGKTRSISTIVNPSSTDITKKLHEENEMLDRMLARSKNQRNDEQLYTAQKSRFKPYDYQETEQEYDSLENLDDPLYSSPTSGTVDKLVTKVAADTVRGYAYKIQIPLSNTQYDVPRVRAPTPDLTNVRDDAPPKPLRR